MLSLASDALQILLSCSDLHPLLKLYPILFPLYRNNRERVEHLRKRRLELKAAKDAKRSKTSEVVKESKHDEPSSDDDSDDNFAVDWRAQHL